MKTLIIALSLVLGACSVMIPQAQVEPELMPYVDRFYREATLRGSPIERREVSAYFGHPSIPGAVGVCNVFTYPSGQKVWSVVIDRVFWDRASDAQREALMFHELGHCVLDRQHAPDEERSLMNRFLPNDYFMLRELYLLELFGS